MSHIGGDSSNITVVQRVTPALRVNVCPQANASGPIGRLVAKFTNREKPADIFSQPIPIQKSVVLLTLTKSQY
jgi:hypothetical protein